MANAWERLHGKVPILPTAGAPKGAPEADDIEEYERRTDWHIIEEYREYWKVFGEGEFCSYFKVLVPGLSLWSLMNTVHSDAARAARGDRYGSWTKRLVPFGSTAGGDLLCFDPEEATKKTSPVFVLPRDAKLPVKAARTLRDFVEHVCMAPEKFQRLLGFKPIGPGLIVQFQPYWAPPGRGPSQIRPPAAISPLARTMAQAGVSLSLPKRQGKVAKAKRKAKPRTRR